MCHDVIYLESPKITGKESITLLPFFLDLSDLLVGFQTLYQAPKSTRLPLSQCLDISISKLISDWPLLVVVLGRRVIIPEKVQRLGI